jgi:hypothetical protein
VPIFAVYLAYEHRLTAGWPAQHYVRLPTLRGDRYREYLTHLAVRSELSCD